MNQEQKQNFKGVNYYRKLLHYDTIVLLIVSILFVIVSAIFIEKTSSGDTVPILLKSILFIIFEIIVLTNKKQIGKIVGVLSVINSSLMIITSLGDGSLFGVVYLLLGIIYLIHSVIYLRKFKESNINYQMTDYENKQNTKLKYLTLIPNILLLPSIFIFIIENTEIRIIVSVTIFLINIINVVFCIYLNKKYSKSILVYITMIISILAVLINGVILIDDIGSEIYKKRKNNYFASEDYYIETAKDLEESLNHSAKYYYESSYYFENTNLDKIIVSKYQAENEFNEKWFKLTKEDLGNCDGYIVISVDQDYINSMIERCKKQYGESFCSSDYIASLDNYGVIETLKINSFISCNGKYTYKTVGFNENYK